MIQSVLHYEYRAKCILKIQDQALQDPHVESLLPTADLSGESELHQKYLDQGRQDRKHYLEQ